MYAYENLGACEGMFNIMPVTVGHSKNRFPIESVSTGGTFEVSHGSDERRHNVSYHLHRMVTPECILEYLPYSGQFNQLSLVLVAN